MIKQKLENNPQTSYSGNMGLIMAILGILCASCVIFFLCRLINDRGLDEIVRQETAIQKSAAENAAERLDLWRAGIAEEASQVSSSEMIRLFAADALDIGAKNIEKTYEKQKKSEEEEDPFFEQYDYIIELLNDFGRRKGWKNVSITLSDGLNIGARNGDSIQFPKNKTLQNGKIHFGPIYEKNGVFLTDIADPLREVLGKNEAKIIGILGAAIPVDDILRETCARHDNGAMTGILFAGEDKPRIIEPVGNGFEIKPAGKFFSNFHSGTFQKMENENESFYLTAKTSGTWLVIAKTPASEIDAKIFRHSLLVYGLGLLAIVGIILFSAWARSYMEKLRAMRDARKYRDLYNLINDQKSLLDGVNNSLGAGLALAESDGSLRMRNSAFAKISKDKVKDIKNLADLLPHDIVLKITDMIKETSGSGKEGNIEIMPDDRLFRMTFYPHSKDGSCVLVAKDITEFRKKSLEARERQRALVNGFMKALESIDPDMAGHSERLARIAALISGEMELSREEAETLDLAAKLSQIGRIYVPRDILSKTGKLNSEEMEEMRRIPEYADDLLHDLHFGLPVRETVALIGERIDGSGSKGMKKDEIMLTGRILALANAFVAMTSKRKWRGGKAMTYEEAIEKLSSDSGFDQELVNILKKIVVNIETPILKS